MLCFTKLFHDVIFVKHSVMELFYDVFFRNGMSYAKSLRHHICIFVF